jgi:hypothetical protein
MKRLLLIFFALILSSAGCSSGNDSSVSHILKGVAAKGAVLPQGCAVEIRGAPSEGNASPVSYFIKASLQGVTWKDVTVSITPKVPSSIVHTTISDNNGNYQADVSSITPPYLIRIQDPVGHVIDQNGNITYYYYSVASNTDTPANVNPLTDAMVRLWYLQSNWTNLCLVNIDSIFESGVYASGSWFYYGGQHWPVWDLNTSSFTGAYQVLPDNTAFLTPNIDEINSAIVEINFWISHATVSGSNFSSVENPISAPWVVGQGFDAVLDEMGANVTDIYMAMWAFYQTQIPLVQNNVKIVAFFGYHNWLNSSDPKNIYVCYTNGGQIVPPGTGPLPSTGVFNVINGTDVSIANGYKYDEIMGGFIQGSYSSQYTFCQIGLNFPDGCYAGFQYNCSTTGNPGNDSARVIEIVENDRVTDMARPDRIVKVRFDKPLHDRAILRKRIP